MNNRFTIPVACAVAFHATLLFGFSRAPRIVTVPSPKPVVKAFPPIIQVDLSDPIKVESNAPKSIGAPDMERLTIDDSPRELKLHDFAINVAPPAPPSTLKSERIAVLPPGDLTGGDKPNFGDTKIVSVHGLDNSPNARVQISPDYPFAAKTEGLEGQVVVEFMVDKTGRVVDPVVVSSSNRIFEESSLRAVAKWRFEPGKRAGEIVPFRMSIPLMFRLGES